VEPYRKTAMETITKVTVTLGSSDIDELLEMGLVNDILCSFQEQTTEDQFTPVLNDFGTVVNTLGKFIILPKHSY
jgi:splicing factor 3B subunit 1